MYVDMYIYVYLSECMYVCMGVYLVPDDTVVDVDVATSHIEAVRIEGLQVQQLPYINTDIFTVREFTVRFP